MTHCGCAYAKIPIRRFSPCREALMSIVAGLGEDIHPPASLDIGKPQRSLWLAYGEDTHPLLPSISGIPKEPCGWTMRRYLFYCITLYREALKILVAGLCEDTHQPASLYIGKP